MKEGFDDPNAIYSQRVRSGNRTYFFDVKATRSNDYYLTITESKRKPKDDGFYYEKHKIFLYKEDFNKFIEALNNTVNHVKDELLPEVDFSEFDGDLLSDEQDVEVSINLADEDIHTFEIDKILDAVDEFMNAMGCELKAQEEPIFGSFFSNLQYIFKSRKTQEEVEQLFKNGKTALKAKYVNLPAAEATEKLTMAASNLISALENQEQAVIRLGAILMVKIIKNGQPLTIVETISPEIMEELNSNASIIRNPEAVFNLLSGNPVDQPDEGESELKWD